MASNDYEGITKVARNRYFVLHSITKLVIVTSYSLITSLVTSLVMLQCVFELKLHFVHFVQSLGGRAAYTARQTSPPSDIGRGVVTLAENSQPCNSMSPESDSRC